MNRQPNSVQRGSGGMSKRASGTRLLYWKKRSLGDKLQLLAALSPVSMRLVEIVVDILLKNAQ